jgi:TPR repeat protein
MYVAGAGVPRDYAEAMRHFRSADTPQAWYQLGLLYQQGLGAPASDAEAAVWWLKAAERGSAEAQYAIGRLYLNRDPVAAYSWFALAAAAGDKEGVAAMKSLAPRLTAQQLAEAQQRALAIAKSRQ